MRKIIPILTLLSAGLLFGGCDFNIANTNKSADDLNFQQNISEFKSNLDTVSKANNDNLNKIKLSKYKLSLLTPEINPAVENLGGLSNQIGDTTAEPNILSNLADDKEILNNETELSNNSSDTNQNNNDLPEININNEEINIEQNNYINDTVSPSEEDERISTLYSLSEDVDNSCGEFCNLKQSLTNAIIETQNLISKVQNKEIELTAEQRMFLTEQSRQLKALGKQLSHSTTELNIYLSDLNNILQNSNGDLDKINLKYMMVLDNLVNGNEMLENSLNSLNLINSMFNLNNTQIPQNNKGRILYGFKRNNEEPIIKDYLIDENGEIKENQANKNETDEQNNSSVETENENTDSEKQTTTDSYKNSKFKSNIDTYYGNNRRNIDSFFNTALLDNEFMYGNNGYGYGPMMGGNMNPYLNNFNGQNANLNNANQQTANNDNTTNSVDNTNNTQQSEKKTKKKFKFKKNIDSYKDENTPTLKTKFSNIKKSVNSFMSKFSKGRRDDSAKNPIYKMDDTTNTSNNY